MPSSSSRSQWPISWTRLNVTWIWSRRVCRLNRLRSMIRRIQRSLPDLLAGLRQELAATAVLLLNDTGRILARAGDFPDRDNEDALISSLLSIHSAGQKVSRLIGQKIASNWYVFDGGKYDLIFAPVGLTHAMLVIGKGIAGEDQLLKTVDIFTEARKNIEQVISEATQDTLTAQEPAPTPLEVVEQNMKEMEPSVHGGAKRNSNPPR